MEKENLSPELTGSMYDEYAGLLGIKKRDEIIAWTELGTDLTSESIQKHYNVFDKYLPFIKKHFDQWDKFNLAIILRSLNTYRSDYLINYLPLFDKNPRILELFYKYSFEHPENIEGDVNKKSGQRLMFAKDENQAHQTITRIEKILEEHKRIYQMLSEKYKDTGENEVVVVQIHDDVDLCIRFMYRDLSDNSGSTEKQQRIDNRLRGVNIKLRPSNKPGHLDFLVYQFNLMASGLLIDDETEGFLFRANPYGIDEKMIVELLAGEKSTEEIKNILESGAANANKYLKLD